MIDKIIEQNRDNVHAEDANTSESSSSISSAPFSRELRSTNAAEPNKWLCGKYVAGVSGLMCSRVSPDVNSVFKDELVVVNSKDVHEYGTDVARVFELLPDGRIKYMLNEHASEL